MPLTIQLIQDLAVVFLAAAAGGLICHRLGLSPIVGYLAGGMLVGPSTPLEALIRDPERVRLLAQLGLVFLMFGIGLNFSLKRLQQLGLPLLGATALTAFIVFDIARLAGGLLGLDNEGSVFLAGMVVVSSSAVIGKILTDSGRSHEKSSQLALGVTLSEDIVAIVMVTLLGSYLQLGSIEGENAPSILQDVALFAGFAVAVGVFGLLVVPRLLRRLGREPNTELENLVVAGVLLGLSVMVMRAGYSLALGAFILGAIIGETPQHAQVERSFASLRDLFGSMFFVAIGMSIDATSLPSAAVPIAVMTLLALVARPLAATLSFLVLGYDGRTGWRAGLILAPLGEFSFIIAQLGITAGILGPEYLTAAIGASLFTAILSPILVRHNMAIADRLCAKKFPLLDRALKLHRSILAALSERQRTNVLWRLLRKRIIQICVEIALVSTVLFFADGVIGWLVANVDAPWLGNVDIAVFFWTVLGLLVLAPLIAIWRNVQVVSMIVADTVAHQSTRLARLRTLIAMGMQTGTLIGLVLWFSNFIPADQGIWYVIAVIALLLGVAMVFWRKLVFWHSHLEISFNEAFDGTDPIDQRAYAWLDRYANWAIEIGEIVLPERFAFAGQSIAQIGIRPNYGSSVIGIRRHSFNIANPGPDSRLFPGDRVLALGTREQIQATREALLTDHPETGDDTFRDLTLDVFKIPPTSGAIDSSLTELNWRERFGVQVVGVEHEKRRRLTPGANYQLKANDRILVLGTPKQLSDFGANLTADDPPAETREEQRD